MTKEKEHLEYNQKWINSGGKLAVYKCKHCEMLVSTPRPSKKEVSSKGYWDSLMECPYCGKKNFVQVYPTGKTTSRGLGL